MALKKLRLMNSALVVLDPLPFLEESITKTITNSQL